MTTQSARERLAEDVARLVAGAAGRTVPRPYDLSNAERIISLIAERLADVTEEMIEAWNKRPLVSKLWDVKTIATADWRAMLSASVLGKGGK